MKRLNLCRYYGGKFYMLKHLLNLIPKHKVYVEPFGGSAILLLNKDPAEIEVYNDLNQGIFNIFHWLKKEPDEFKRLVNLTPYHELNVKQNTLNETLEDAVNYYAKIQHSFAANPVRHNFSFGKRPRGNMASEVSRWLGGVDKLTEIIERIKSVQFFCRDALSIIPKFDSDETFYYLDPPYLLETRKDKKVYTKEMSSEDHIQLIELIKTLKGKVLLSGYDNEIYNNLEWKKIKFDVNSPRKKETKHECLWLNY